MATAYNIVGMNFVPHINNKHINECDKETQDQRLLLGACALLQAPCVVYPNGENETVKCGGRNEARARGCSIIIEASGIRFRVNS